MIFFIKFKMSEQQEISLQEEMDRNEYKNYCINTYLEQIEDRSRELYIAFDEKVVSKHINEEVHFDLKAGRCVFGKEKMGNCQRRAQKIQRYAFKVVPICSVDYQNPSIKIFDKNHPSEDCRNEKIQNLVEEHDFLKGDVPVCPEINSENLFNFSSMVAAVVCHMLDGRTFFSYHVNPRNQIWFSVTEGENRFSKRFTEPFETIL